MSTASEIIVAAAIRLPVAQEFRAKVWNGERSYPDHIVITSPPPARHHTLLHTTHALAVKPEAFEDQGFITSTGRYVERDEALKIAIESGQPMIDHPSRHHRWLFSEDLW